MTYYTYNKDPPPKKKKKEATTKNKQTKKTNIYIYIYTDSIGSYLGPYISPFSSSLRMLEARGSPG